MTYRNAAWTFLRGLKVLEGIEETGGAEGLLYPPGGFLDKDGNIRPHASDGMDVGDFHAAILTLCHQPVPEDRDEREQFASDIVGDNRLMSALEELARELVEPPKEEP